MKCPHCETTHIQAIKFCSECGTRIGRKCPLCNAIIPAGNKFCSECGANLSLSVPEAPSTGPNDENSARPTFNKGERRHITVLFSDLSNYVVLSENHDPEDVQRLMTKVIGKGRQIIESYGGHVERVIGDEILAVFGLPKVHEDDAVRAIKAAQEHHAEVNRIGTSGRQLFDQPISMHTGINSGLVVIDNLSPGDNVYGVSGDTVNLASRLADIASPDEILVGQEVYKQAHGFFCFDRKPAAHIKGKSETIQIYAVTETKPRPIKVRRNLGLRAHLVGRKAEFTQLQDAVVRLKNGKGSIFSLIGEAGTGKSRLLNEFQKAYQDENFQWITGYAYAHTQGIAYYPLINLLRQFYEIEDTHSVEEVRTRIKKVTTELLGDTVDEIPIVENLYGLKNKATKNMSPKIWQQRLTNTISRIISALALRKPTIFCMEDIHWTDFPTVAILREIVTEFRPPAILICTFRPPFSFFAGHQLHSLMPLYHEIRLGELSYSEAQDLVISLLNEGTIPMELLRSILDRAEGNPFYLEELINALVESGVLVCRKSTWSLTRDLIESDIPSTIHGVITARLDRLSQPARRVLQEGAVIGRVFLYKLLQRVSVYSSRLDDILNELEQSGLISPRAQDPEIEMMFKHALIQEICYSNLLRSERQRVHGRIGSAMETLFADRLNEFYETMALHFKRGECLEKAIFYQIRSGNKALRRCALEESHRHFLGAKRLAEKTRPATVRFQEHLVDVLSQWGFVYYYRGRFRELQELLDVYHPMVKSLPDLRRQGLFWAWRGWTLWHRGRFETAYHELRKAHALGEKTNGHHLISQTCNWLTWTCADTGRLDEAVSYADQAIALYTSGQIKESYIYFNTLAAKGYACWHRGESGRTRSIGNRLIGFGHQNTNVHSVVLGHCCVGWSHLIRGDIDQAKVCFEEAVHVSTDPWYATFPKLALGLGYTAAGAGAAAEPLLQELIEFSDTNGAEFLGTTASFFLELCHLTVSNATDKIRWLFRQLENWRQDNGWLRFVICAHLMAHRFVELVQQIDEENLEGQQDLKFQILDKAEHWFKICAEESQAKGAASLNAISHLGLGRCYAIAKQPEDAKKTLEKAIGLFEQCNADHYLAQARELLSIIQTECAELSAVN
jgi:class 3 adenylate cyclase/tetratricopeptide (TPR) repeat protein